MSKEADAIDLSAIGSDLPPADQIEEDTKEQRTLFGAAKRREEKKDAVHVIFIWTLRVVAGAFVVVLLVRIWHFLVPEEGSGMCPRCWLSDEQLQTIDKFFFSGAIGALVARYIREIVSDDPSDESVGFGE